VSTHELLSTSSGEAGDYQTRPTNADSGARSPTPALPSLFRLQHTRARPATMVDAPLARQRSLQRCKNSLTPLVCVNPRYAYCRTPGVARAACVCVGQADHMSFLSVPLVRVSPTDPALMEHFRAGRPFIIQGGVRAQGAMGWGGERRLAGVRDGASRAPCVSPCARIRTRSRLGTSRCQ
jgi:hypothetical protein